MAHYINIYGKRLFDIGLYLKTSVDLILQQQHVLMSQQKFTDISLCHREAPNPVSKTSSKLRTKFPCLPPKYI